MQRREADRQKQRGLRPYGERQIDGQLASKLLLRTDLRTSHLRSPAPAAQLRFAASPLVLDSGFLVAGAPAAFIGQPSRRCSL